MHWLAVEEQRSRANIQLGQAEWSGGGGGGGGGGEREVGLWGQQSRGLGRLP